MNLIDGTNTLNTAANELVGRLRGCLQALRGPVPENTTPQGKPMSSGLTGDLERCAGTLHEGLALMSELESLTVQSKNIGVNNNQYPPAVGIAGRF